MFYTEHAGGFMNQNTNEPEMSERDRKLRNSDRFFLAFWVVMLIAGFALMYFGES